MFDTQTPIPIPMKSLTLSLAAIAGAFPDSSFAPANPTQPQNWAKAPMPDAQMDASTAYRLGLLAGENGLAVVFSCNTARLWLAATAPKAAYYCGAQRSQQPGLAWCWSTATPPVAMPVTTCKHARPRLATTSKAFLTYSMRKVNWPTPSVPRLPRTCSCSIKTWNSCTKAPSTTTAMPTRSKNTT